MKKIITLASITFLLTVTPSLVAENNSECSQFVRPKKMDIITDSLLTVAVEACDSIKSVNFKIRYTNENGIPNTIPLGMISRRPFKLLRPIDDISNQLTKGITCFAECIYENGDVLTITREGVFLAHKPMEKLVYPVKLEKESSGKIKKGLYLSSNMTKDRGQTEVTWDGKIIKFRISINSPLFYSSAQKNVLSKCGITICLDPENTGTPHISDKIKIIRFPTTGNPSELKVISGYDSSERFIMREKRRKWPHPFKCKLYDFKGYTFSIDIPISEIDGLSPGDTVGCNVIATVFDQNLNLIDLGWREGEESLIYSPMAYGKMIFEKKSINFSLILLWLGSFLGGILLTLLPMIVIKKLKRGTDIQKFEASEKDAKLLENIEAIIDAEITNINFSIENITAKLSTTPKRVNKLIRQNFKISFEKYILKCRMEIVKERLRSSNASEASIAKACGFSTVDEMEKAFKSTFKTSPYRFREENRVS